MKKNNQLTFRKMHGLGNDFIVLDGINHSIDLNARQIRSLSNRHTGIGFDQCLIIEPPKDSTMDFFYRIYNADGSEVGQCGNGARCIAKFIRDQGLSGKQEFIAATSSSILRLRPETENEVFVETSTPNFEPETIPLSHGFQADFYPFKVDCETHYLHCVNVGNPHGILVVDDLWQANLKQLGEALVMHPKFTEGANISFVKIIDKQNANLRVFERGAGETLACGSAALASMACLKLFHKCSEQFNIHLPGGSLRVHWKGLDHKISFVGPATNVFDGKINL